MTVEYDIEHKKEIKDSEYTPKKYNVLMHNDNHTSMDFVIFILTELYQKNEKEAFDLMMEIHVKGKAIVGNYTQEIAETKVSQTLSSAKHYGFPLFCESIPE